MLQKRHPVTGHPKIREPVTFETLESTQPP